MGRRRQERILEEALTRAAAAGIERGRREGVLSVLARIARRLFARDTQDVTRMLAQDGPERTLDALQRLAREVWIPRWVEGVSPVLGDVMDAAELPTNRGPVRLGFDLANPLNAEFFSGYTLRLAEQVTNTTREKLEGAIREGIEKGLSVPEVADKVSEAGEEFSKSRSETIARTELHRAAISSSEMQARRSGVVSHRVWRATFDERTRPEHRRLEGVRVGLDEPFPDGLHPATEVNCRCYLEFELSDEALRQKTA